MNKDNATWVLTRFIKELAIPVTRQSISDELEKHANCNSLLAFSDVLDRWQVPNEAYKLDFEQLQDVTLPFIAHISRKNFAVVSRMDGNTVVLSSDKWTNKTVAIEEFKKLY